MPPVLRFDAASASIFFRRQRRVYPAFSAWDCVASKSTRTAGAHVTGCYMVPVPGARREWRVASFEPRTPGVTSSAADRAASSRKALETDALNRAVCRREFECSAGLAAGDRDAAIQPRAAAAIGDSAERRDAVRIGRAIYGDFAERNVG